ncbi:glycosyltransferase [Comamonas jiangduensis]|uniref:glycosyltransferase n=1 Tax=Comamonas jiangduensis TaxID=1194168 RepID=UPI003BF89595
MKILFTLTGLGMGGAERQVLDLAANFQKRGHNISIIFFTGEATAKNIPPNVRIIKMDFKKNPFKSFFLLRQFINQENPDIVHSHMIHANIITRIARVFTKINRLVCTAHNKYEGGKIRMLAYRLTDNFADITTNVSQEAVANYIKIRAAPQNKIKCVYNGIDTEKFKSNLEYRNITRNNLFIDEKIVFLAVGRLTEAKDYPNLLIAFRKFLKEKKINSYHLLIIGDGEKYREIIELIEHLNLTKNVTLLGIRDDVDKIMNSADYFVLSSAWEGFGLVVAEAMATEKIVIATDSGGVAEVLNGHGFLVKPKDSDALCNAMIEASLLDKYQKKNIENNARTHIIKNFSIDSISKQWIDIYDFLISGKKY